VTGNATCNTALWVVLATTAAVEIQQYVPFVLLLTYIAAHCCHGNATMGVICCVVELIFVQLSTI
jgi:hypothetical protein